MVLSTLTISSVAKLESSEFLSWGWRIPFLLSSVLFVIGAYIRARVAESPVFVHMQKTKDVAERPFVEAMTKGRRSFLTAVGLKLSEVSWVYILTVFVVVYATTQLQLSKDLILSAILYGAALEIITIPMFGWLSDKVGRRPLYIWGAIFSIIFPFPMFWMLNTKIPFLVVLTIIVGMNLGHALMFAPEATYFPELFKGRVRCTGASFGFQVSAAIGGGLAPIVATVLLGYFGGTAGVSIMLILFALITLFAALRARETYMDKLV
jgi:MHS family shikimate/dehydroshikimate transporter-like MFS transporter